MTQHKSYWIIFTEHPTSHVVKRYVKARDSASVKELVYQHYSGARVIAWGELTEAVVIEEEDRVGLIDDSDLAPFSGTVKIQTEEN